MQTRQRIQGILLYGHDDVLMMTRARILECAGFRTSVTSELGEVSRLVRRLPADLIVLCHSLSRTECATAALIAKHYQPRARTLLMVADGSTGEDDGAVSELADDFFFLTLEPEELVEKVREMLDERHSRLLRFPARVLMPGGHFAQTS